MAPSSKSDLHIINFNILHHYTIIQSPLNIILFLMHRKESMMLNIDLIKKGQNKMDESYITEASSVLKRRKTKLTKNKNAE